MLKLEKRDLKEAMDELEKDGTIKKLNDASTLSLTQFVDFLFNNFPAKHKKKVEKPKVEPGKEKKVCIQLNNIYHPDKVKEMYGQKYKVLCEEITKRINERLGQYKGVQ